GHTDRTQTASSSAPPTDDDPSPVEQGPEVPGRAPHPRRSPAPPGRRLEPVHVRDPHASPHRRPVRRRPAPPGVPGPRTPGPRHRGSNRAGPGGQGPPSPAGGHRHVLVRYHRPVDGPTPQARPRPPAPRDRK